jgi:hypothetical protein
LPQLLPQHRNYCRSTAIIAAAPLNALFKAALDSGIQLNRVFRRTRKIFPKIHRIADAFHDCM